MVMIDGTSLLKPSEPRSASVLATSVVIAAPSSTHGMTAGLEIEGLRDQLALIRGVAERHLRRLRALEVQMHIVLPRETDATVHLDTVARHLPVSIGHVRLRHRRCKRAVGGVGFDRPGGVVRGGPPAFGQHQHVCQLVRNGLIDADRLAELLARFGVLGRCLEDLLDAADHLGAECGGRPLEGALQRRPPLSGPPMTASALSCTASKRTSLHRRVMSSVSSGLTVIPLGLPSTRKSVTPSSPSPRLRATTTV